MLKLYFGEIEGAELSGDGFFDFSPNIDRSVITTEIGKTIVKGVDNSEVVGEFLIVSPVLGAIAPEFLSGGCKMLLCMLSSDFVVDLASMGDNCFPYLKMVTDNKDCILCSDSFRRLFDGGFESVYIINLDREVHSNKELWNAWMECRDGVISGESKIRL